MAENAILVTTETESGKRYRHEGVVVCWILGVLCFAAAVFCGFAPDCCFHRPPDLWGRVFLVFSCGATGVLFPVAFRFDMRGNWRLDDEGVSFTPLRGNPRHVAWRDVDAVFAPCRKTQQVLLRAGKMKLPIDLRWETCQRQDEVRDFLRTKLEGVFDIFDRPVAQGSSRRWIWMGGAFEISDRPVAKTSIRRWLWISAAASAATLLYFGILILPSFCLQYEHWRCWALVWMLLPFVVLFPWAMVIAWLERRKAWSWRKS
jgi:hypothetical protein